VDVDSEIFVLARVALRLLQVRSATFAASDIGMGSIPGIQTDEVELLTCGTEIAVAFGKKGETLGTVERVVLAESAVPKQLESRLEQLTSQGARIDNVRAGLLHKGIEYRLGKNQRPRCCRTVLASKFAANSDEYVISSRTVCRLSFAIGRSWLGGQTAITQKRSQTPYQRPLIPLKNVEPLESRRSLLCLSCWIEFPAIRVARALVPAYRRCRRLQHRRQRGGLGVFGKCPVPYP